MFFNKIFLPLASHCFYIIKNKRKSVKKLVKHKGHGHIS